MKSVALFLLLTLAFACGKKPVAHNNNHQTPAPVETLQAITQACLENELEIKKHPLESLGDLFKRVEESKVERCHASRVQIYHYVQSIFENNVSIF